MLMCCVTSTEAAAGNSILPGAGGGAPAAAAGGSGAAGLTGAGGAGGQPGGTGPGGIPGIGIIGTTLITQHSDNERYLLCPVSHAIELVYEKQNKHADNHKKQCSVIPQNARERYQSLTVFR